MKEGPVHPCRVYRLPHTTSKKTQNTTYCRIDNKNDNGSQKLQKEWTTLSTKSVPLLPPLMHVRFWWHFLPSKKLPSTAQDPHLTATYPIQSFCHWSIQDWRFVSSLHDKTKPSDERETFCLFMVSPNAKQRSNKDWRSLLKNWLMSALHNCE